MSPSSNGCETVMGNYLRLERHGAVAVITLCNAERMNPLASDMQSELLVELLRLKDDRSVRALVLTAEGRAFCVGADLASMKQQAGDARTLGERIHELMGELTNLIPLALRDVPFPVVCAVNGACAGAGVGLALSADVVLMARSAYFYLPFIPKLGIVPDMGGTWYLERLAGRGRAVALTLLGDRLPAEQAVAWGVAWAAFDDVLLQQGALEMARKLAKIPRHAALETRRVYDQAASNGLAQQLDYERGRQRELLDRSSFAEGVAAFLEKREPRFE
jgi:2-(1,2-epoxy-1,2-dihydrophenyl)acetyl-CoA isomerase